MQTDRTLARRLTAFDAVVIGLGSMIGAGVFAAVGPASAAAGSWLLAGLALAGGVAYANATSSARLAAVHPESGGTYLYARARLGPLWGFLAGWCFVVGKTASLAAVALTFGNYVHAPSARALAVAAIVSVTAVNFVGVEKTARLTAVVVVLVLAALGVAVAASLSGDRATLSNLAVGPPGGPLGVLRSAGLLFFAFAGYARIATLGEEVRDPERTIPRAVPIALAIALVVYLVVMASALVAVGPQVLARSPAPIADAARAGAWPAAVPVVGAGSAVASLGVLLSLNAGVSRTMLAMARRREMPAFLDAIHPRFRSPHRAEVTVAAVVAAIVVVVDLRAMIGFSSFAVLSYYALANASALTLPHRRLAVVGLAGCAVLAVTLPLASVISGAGLLGAGAGVWFVRRRRSLARTIRSTP